MPIPSHLPLRFRGQIALNTPISRIVACTSGRAARNAIFRTLPQKDTQPEHHAGVIYEALDHMSGARQSTGIVPIVDTLGRIAVRREKQTSIENYGRRRCQCKIDCLKLPV